MRAGELAQVIDWRFLRRTATSPVIRLCGVSNPRASLFGFGIMIRRDQLEPSTSSWLIDM
jgi:hypothetical protein